jgi:hypothetical protein
MLAKIPAPILSGIATGAVGLGAHYLMKKFGNKEKQLVNGMDPALQHIYHMGKQQVLSQAGHYADQYLPPNIKQAVRDYHDSADVHNRLLEKAAHHEKYKHHSLREITEPYGVTAQMKESAARAYHGENRVAKIHNDIVDNVNSAPERLKGAFGPPTSSWLD